MNLPILVGMPVLSHHGEGGLTHFGQEIETGPNALGIVVSIDPNLPDNPISVVFAHGIIAALSPAEIYNRQNYALDVTMPPGFDSQAVLSWGDTEPDDFDKYRLYARNLMLANFEMATYVASDAKISAKEFEVTVCGYAFEEGPAAQRLGTGNKALEAEKNVGMDGISIYPTGKRQVGISASGTPGYWLEFAIELDKTSIDEIDPGTVLSHKGDK